MRLLGKIPLEQDTVTEVWQCEGAPAKPPLICYANPQHEIPAGQSYLEVKIARRQADGFTKKIVPRHYCEQHSAEIRNKLREAQGGGDAN